MELDKTNLTPSFAQYQFVFKAQDNIKLQEFNASTWRGIFGRALKQIACTTHADSCEGCLLKSQCAYGYVFESSPTNDSDRMRKYSAIPHPYVIKNKTKKQIAVGETFHLTFLLFGKAISYLPYVIQAFIEAGKRGITQQRSVFSVESVHRKNQNEIDIIWTKTKSGIANVTAHGENSFPTLSKTKKSKIKIRFITPVKIMRDGKQITPVNFQLKDLIRSLTRRISMLMYFHSAQELDLDYTKMHRLAEDISWKSDGLKQAQWKRYSNRQKKAMNIRGIVGEVTFTLTVEQEPLWQLLWIGSQIHAGKLTTMGLGEYTIKNW